MARRRGEALPPVEEFYSSGATPLGDNHPPPDTSLRDEVERLRELGDIDMLKEARVASIRLLLAKLNLGEISAAEHAVLRNLLRDNGMVLGMDQPPEDDTPTSPVGFHLPDLSADEDDD